MAASSSPSWSALPPTGVPVRNRESARRSQRALASQEPNGDPAATGALVERTKQAFRRHRPGGGKVSEAHLQEVWLMTTTMLQQFDLCINFSALDFFGMPVGNGQFKTEQVSAALNYGAQRHGPRSHFGMSYFVLRDDLKSTALYYVRDALLGSRVHEAVSYDALGAIYGLAARYNQPLRHALDEVCFLHGTLPETSSAEGRLLSIEARLSERYPLTGGIRAVHLSPLSPPKVSGQPLDAPLSGQLWADIRHNAQSFAEKYGSQLIVMSDETTTGTE